MRAEKEELGDANQGNGRNGVTEVYAGLPCKQHDDDKRPGLIVQLPKLRSDAADEKHQDGRREGPKESISDGRHGGFYRRITFWLRRKKT